MNLVKKGEEISKLRGVISTSVVTGRYDLITLVLFKEGFGLLEFYTDEMSKVDGIRAVETFVEKDRFVGTSYKAANWTYVGETKGRGKLGPSGKQSVPIKDMWLYPLARDFRSTLTQ